MTVSGTDVRAKLRVLIVEDEAIVAFDLAQTLSEMGFTKISFAHTLSSGLRLIEVEKPDLAVLDVNIGPEEVFPLADVLSQSGTPFVFCTARLEPMPERFAKRAVASKPVSPSTLRQAICDLGL